MTFEGDLEDRERLALLFFARINQRIATEAGTGFDGSEEAAARNGVAYHDLPRPS